MSQRARRGQRIHQAAASALTLLLCSCAGKVIEVDGVTVYEEIWESTVRTLSTRVKFDFDCDEPPEFTLIVRKGRHPSQVGVRACGKAGTYLRGPRNLWILGESAGSEARAD